MIIHIKPDGISDSEADALIAQGAAHGLNRQCSIGFHEECSDPQGDECRCDCHDSLAGA